MKLLYQPFKLLPENKYLVLVTFLIPILNFLNGILIDMYTPSMPQIAIDLHTTSILVKNTITATILGYGIGAFIFGVIFDLYGRRPVILVGISLFILTSLFATFNHNITSLIIIRFIQGLIGSIMSIGSRIMALDHFKGKKLTVVILYASLAFGIGTVIAPFIGGFLQYHFGWHANFIVFMLTSCAILIPYILYVQERYMAKNSFNLLKTLKTYQTLLQCKGYLAVLGILSLLQFELLFFPTVGSFVIEHKLGYSPIIFGNTSFIVGLGYLLGTLTNRVLLKYHSQQQLITSGLKIQALTLFILFITSILLHLSLWSFMLPFTLFAYAVGFILGNISSVSLQRFASNGSIVASVNASIMMLIASVLCYIISYVNISSLFTLFLIFLPLLGIKIILFSRYFKTMISKIE